MFNRETRYQRELNTLLQAIEANRILMVQAKASTGHNLKQPALWISAGSTAFRVFRMARLSLFVVSRVGHFARLGRILKFLPLAGAAWGAYQLGQG